MIDVKQFAIAHDFNTVAISWSKGRRWNVTVHGQRVGEFGCAFGYGETPDEAASALLKAVRTYRDDAAALAAGDKAAKAARIAKIKAELESLEGSAA